MSQSDSQGSSIQRGNRYYLLLSGEHPKLPEEEAKALLESMNINPKWFYRLDYLLLFETPNIDGTILSRIVDESGYIREGGISLRVVDEEPEVLGKALSNLALHGRYWVEYEKHGMPEWSPSGRDIIRIVANSIGSDRLGKDGSILKIDHFPGYIHIGLSLAKKDYDQFRSRSPRKRPAFRPGTLDSRLSRAFVNLSRPSGEVFLDPFCGVGGFSIEAGLVGFSLVICGDIEYKMIRGAMVNLNYYLGNRTQTFLYYGDAGSMPLREESVDRIATDPPYGRTTTTRGEGIREVLERFLREAVRVLKPGGYVVFASPLQIQPHYLAEKVGLIVEGYLEMYVHRGLIRSIVIAKKPFRTSSF